MQVLKRPDDFVDFGAFYPRAVLDVRYAGSFNFVGRPINGYLAPKIYVTLPAAQALKRAGEQFYKMGYCMKIYDGFRPLRAVNDFLAWEQDEAAVQMKPYFFPTLTKQQVFEGQYIARRSSHSRGSTVDMTLVDQSTNEDLDMGSTFDYFGEISHQQSPLITPLQAQNRQLLNTVMLQNGFALYPQEWWHFTLQNESLPGHLFCFAIE